MFETLHPKVNMKTILLLILCSTACFAAKLSYNTHGTFKHLNGGRIVNGTDAAVGQFPFIVSLRWPELASHWCGGSIISPNFVVTAGHCCETFTVEELTVVAGSNVLSGGDPYKVKEIILHPEFSDEIIDLKNDICLLHLESDIQFGDNVQTIPLSQNVDDSPVDAIVAGWGNLEYLGETPEVLQWLPTHIVPHEECVEFWGNHAYYPIRESQVCAFIQKGQGACNGDSGGPLTTVDENGNTVLTGVVSWGDPCALGYPDVYTKANSYVDWIQSVANIE